MMDTGYFNSEIAQKYGVIAATFLQMLYRVTIDNKDKCVIEDGAFWFQDFLFAFVGQKKHTAFQESGVFFYNRGFISR